MIPYGHQNISDEDIKSVVDVLKSEYLTQGPIVPKFEKIVCDYTGANFAVAVNSGTSALHIACLALGVGKNDLVWTTPITFVASANSALYCGAKIDFVDIDTVTWNMSTDALSKKLKDAKKNESLPKVLIVVHFCGTPCDMSEIHALSQEYGFKIIEDACHAIGAKYLDSTIGACQYSDITVFSFHPVKTITTGEGGMAVTNDKLLVEKMELLRSHGITRNPDEMTQEPDGPWYYEQISLGFNYRMTDMQAALGVSQMTRLDEFVSKRQMIANNYDRLLSDLPIKSQNRSTESYSGMHLYVIRLSTDKIKKTHKEIFLSMREKGIGVNLHYMPIHLQPYYKKLGFNHGDFPNAEAYYLEAITLPMFPDLTKGEQEKVIKTLGESLS